MKLTETQKQRVQGIGKKHDLKLILLHGSYATGKNKKGSDLDIAVLGNKEIKIEKLLKIHSDLADIFGDNHERELDLKSIHKIDPLLCYYIARDSQLLYGDIADYSKFKAYAFSNFFDTIDLRRLEKSMIYKFQTYLNKKYA